MSDEWTIFQLRLDQCFHKVSFLFEISKLDNLSNTANFSHAFLHSKNTWLSKLRFLRISIPNNFWFSFFQISASSINLNIFMLMPKLKDDMSFLRLMLLGSNHSVSKNALCSNLLIKLFRSLSQA